MQIMLKKRSNVDRNIGCGRQSSSETALPAKQKCLELKASQPPSWRPAATDTMKKNNYSSSEDGVNERAEGIADGSEDGNQASVETAGENEYNKRRWSSLSSVVTSFLDSLSSSDNDEKRSMSSSLESGEEAEVEVEQQRRKRGSHQNKRRKHNSSQPTKTIRSKNQSSSSSYREGLLPVTNVVPRHHVNATEGQEVKFTAYSSSTSDSAHTDLEDRQGHPKQKDRNSIVENMNCQKVAQQQQQQQQQQQLLALQHHLGNRNGGETSENVIIGYGLDGKPLLAPAKISQFLLSYLSGKRTVPPQQQEQQQEQQQYTTQTKLQLIQNPGLSNQMTENASAQATRNINLLNALTQQPQQQPPQQISYPQQMQQRYQGLPMTMAPAAVGAPTEQNTYGGLSVASSQQDQASIHKNRLVSSLSEDYRKLISTIVSSSSNVSYNSGGDSDTSSSSFPGPGMFLSTQPIYGPRMSIKSDEHPSLYVPSDDEILSPFYRLVRKQMQFFEADHGDVISNNRGRIKSISVGQVGIRCIHCAAIPPEEQVLGTTYFPAKLDLLYQAAQHMVKKHICDKCPNIPPETKNTLCKLKSGKSKNGCGKSYWADTAIILGVREQGGILCFLKS